MKLFLKILFFTFTLSIITVGEVKSSAVVNPVYTYDANGNMNHDGRKNIDIEYNLLNLPHKISQNSTVKATYTYLADGTKVTAKTTATIVIPPFCATKTIDIGFEYLGSFVYLNYDGTKMLESAPFGGGRINATGSDYDINYFITDHLGSVRVIVNPLGDILEQNDYYPFGLRHDNANLINSNNRWGFVGEELQTLGLIGDIDLGRRSYDPFTGRTRTPDRFAEKYYGFSQYSYAGNNPINIIDINGDSLWITHNKERILYENGNLYNQDGTAYAGKALKVNKKDGTTKLTGFVGKAKDALDKIGSGADGGNLIEQLQSSNKNITISQGSNVYSFANNNWRDATNGTGTDGNIKWSPSNNTGGPNTAGNNSRPSYIGLAHELGHALDGANGTMDRDFWFLISTGNDIKSIYNTEKSAIHWENKIRAENGIPLRTYYHRDYSESRVLINGAQSRFFNNYHYINNVVRSSFIRLLGGF